jgi:hypothetical protein
VRLRKPLVKTRDSADRKYRTAGKKKAALPLSGRRIKTKRLVPMLMRGWNTPAMQLSCEIEGHPLGGGLLKLEPREAANVVVPHTKLLTREMATPIINEAIHTLRRWRHYANGG